MSAPATASPAAPDGWLQRASRALGVVEMAVGGAMLVALLGLVLLQVLLRLVPGLFAGVWTGELARLMLVSLTFAVAGRLTGRGEHITLDMIDHVLGPRQMRAVEAFASVVVGITSIAFATEAWALLTSGAVQRLPSLGIPVSTIYAVPFVGLVLSAFRAFLGLFAGKNG
ncbi:MAG TPA: TRAP transporter small permease subunit [Egicoccus sp.]|nr:TRAP transporter small permease subunit [Egicoccus sp.]HSK24266.1 TRAP transporter small permease subunit [Egicoccus sp.]